MRLLPAPRWPLCWLGIFWLATSFAPLPAAEPSDPRLEAFRDRPLAEKLASPRRTIETLCFMMDVYDRVPTMLPDAVACLEIEANDGFEAGTAGLLAIQLGEILDELSFPFEGCGGGADGKPVTFYEDKDIRVVLALGADGLWRFDRGTVARITMMRQTMAVRARQRNLLRSQLREGLEDPTATMTTFLDHAIAGDFESAAARLDLSFLTPDQRPARGPLLAWKLACIMQRRGYLFRQSVPVDPDGAPYTWSADTGGRITVERVRRPGGKDAWLFGRATVEGIDALWEKTKSKPPDARYLFLKAAVPLPPDHLVAPPDDTRAAPATVPPQLAAPRTMLREFFRVMDEAEYDDAKLLEARQFLDLSHLPHGDLEVLGPKLTTMLEAVFRQLKADLSTVSDKWSAPPQILTGAGNLRVEVVRQTDGCWRISSETVAHLPAMYESISGQEKASNERTQGQGSPRETLVTFLRAINSGDSARASRCLDLSDFPVSAQDNRGPVLAFKLKSVLDRTGRIYLQEIPNDPDGPRLMLYRGALGRITVARREDDASKSWRFTSSTVGQIETMFNRALDQPVDATLRTSNHIRLEPSFWQEPGVWFRVQMPPAWRQSALGLQCYQWPGLGLALLGALLVALVAGLVVRPLLVWFFAVRTPQADAVAVRRKLGSLRFLVFVLVLYHLVEWVDLPAAVAAQIYSLEKLVNTIALVWAAFQVTDLIYLFSRGREPVAHRGLGDLVGPFIVRIVKIVLLLSGLTFLVYEFGQGDTLKQFLTGLGIAGLAVSLAAQDSLKNLFATLLLIGDRSFRVGDRLVIGDKEGVVEQLGFRSTKLRTAEDSLMIVPNAFLASGAIDNLGLRLHRHVHTSFTVPVSTPLDRIAALRDSLRDYLAQRPDVDQQRSAVSIVGINTGGIGLEVQAYFEAKDGQTEQQCQEDLTCEIVKRAGMLEVALSAGK